MHNQVLLLIVSTLIFSPLLISGQTLVNLQDGVSYSVQLNSSLVFRIATPYKYAQLNISVITPSSSLQYQISKGWIPTLPVAGPGGAAPSASGSVSNSSSASLIIGDDPIETQNHYLSFLYTTALVNLTVTVTPMPYPYVDIEPKGIAVIDFTVPVGNSLRIPVFSFISESSYDLVHIACVSSNCGSYYTTVSDYYRTPSVGDLGASRAAPLSSVFQQYGTRVYVQAVISSSTIARNFSIAVSLPTGVRIVDMPTSFSLNVSIYRPTFLRLRFPNFVGVSNLTVRAATLSPHQIYFVPTDYRWPSWSFQRSQYQNVYSTFSPTTFQLDSRQSVGCDVDMNARETYVRIVMEQGSPNLPAESILNGSVTYQLDLEFYASPSAVLTLNPGVSQSLSGSSVVKLSGFDTAIASGATLGIFRSSLNSYMVAGASSYFTASSSECPKGVATWVARLNPNIQLTSDSVPACRVYPGGPYDASAVISGSISFSYNYTAPRSLLLGQTLALSTYAYHHLFTGPSDPALYPIVVRITPISIATSSGGAYIFPALFGQPLCGGMRTSSPQACVYSYSLTTCYITLGCPSEGLYFAAGANSAIIQANSFNFTIVSTGITQALNVPSGSSSWWVQLPQNVATALAVSPAGQKYRITVRTNSTLDSAIPVRFIPGGCGPSAGAVVYDTNQGSTERQIDISGPGTLILLGSSTNALNFTISFAERGAPAPALPDCSYSSSSIPAVCKPRLLSAAYIGSPSFYSYASSVSSYDGYFASLYPAEKASNTSCYQAWLTVMCNALLPRCDGAGAPIVAASSSCAGHCRDIFAQAGCNNVVMQTVCNSQVSCPTADFYATNASSFINYAPNLAPTGPIPPPFTVQPPNVAAPPTSAQAPYVQDAPQSSPQPSAPPSMELPSPIASVPSDGLSPPTGGSDSPQASSPPQGAAVPTSVSSPQSSANSPVGGATPRGAPEATSVNGAGRLSAGLFFSAVVLAILLTML